jgi:DNA repair protein RecO (recombination protein O)
MPETARSFRAEAVVLRHSNFGEADRVLVLYTRDQGKIRTIAKGVRKIKSRKAGHLEPFSRITLQLARGHDLAIITQAETVESYTNIRTNLELTGYTAVVIELVDRFTFEAEENRLIYQILTETLHRLDQGEDPFITVRYYEIHLLDALGYRPELFACSVCRKEIQPVDQYFSPEQGGVVCPQCARNISGARPISMQALKYLRHLQRSPFAEAGKAHPDPSTRGEMEDVLQDYLTYILERSLNAPRFLREIHHIP